MAYQRARVAEVAAMQGEDRLGYGIGCASHAGCAAQHPADPSADSTRASDRYDSEILLGRLLSSPHLLHRLRAGPVSTPPVDTLGLAVGRCCGFGRVHVSGCDPCLLEVVSASGWVGASLEP